MTLKQLIPALEEHLELHPEDAGLHIKGVQDGNLTRYNLEKEIKNPDRSYSLHLGPTKLKLS